MDSYWFLPARQMTLERWEKWLIDECLKVWWLSGWEAGFSLSLPLSFSTLQLVVYLVGRSLLSPDGKSVPVMLFMWLCRAVGEVDRRLFYADAWKPSWMCSKKVVYYSEPQRQAEQLVNLDPAHSALYNIENIMMFSTLKWIFCSSATLNTQRPLMNVVLMWLIFLKVLLLQSLCINMKSQIYKVLFSQQHKFYS